MTDATCPCCGALILDAIPASDLAEMFPPRMAGILRTLESGRTKTVWDLVDGAFGDNPDHWPRCPEDAVRIVISQRRSRLAELGWSITAIRGTGYRLVRNEK